tara:strand:+ start:3019 stop:3963 length:945 start_codon:yes stop_codon:yes gene_type:complete
MNFLTLIKKESNTTLHTLAIMALITGLGNGAMLAIVNAAAASTSNQDVNFQYLLLFIIAICLFIYTKRYTLRESIIIVENILCNVRLRVSDKIRHSNLLFIEKLGKSEIYNILTRQTNILSETSHILVSACQSSIMLVFCTFYIAWLSKTALFITLTAIACGFGIYYRNKRVIDADVKKAIEKETEFFDSLNHILDGLKEIKLNRRKNDDLFSSFKTIAEKTRELNISSGLKYINNFIFSQSIWYIVIASIVFILPTLSSAYAEIVLKTTMAIFFMIGPVEILISSVPIFTKANIAINNMSELEKRLDAAERMP